MCAEIEITPSCFIIFSILLLTARTTHATARTHTMPDDYGYPAGAKQRSDYEPFRLVNVWKKVGQEGEGWGARVACPRLCGTLWRVAS